MLYGVWLVVVNQSLIRWSRRKYNAWSLLWESGLLSAVLLLSLGVGHRDRRESHPRLTHIASKKSGSDLGSLCCSLATLADLKDADAGTGLLCYLHNTNPSSLLASSPIGPPPPLPPRLLSTSSSLRQPTRAIVHCIPPHQLTFFLQASIFSTWHSRHWALGPLALLFSL